MTEIYEFTEKDLSGIHKEVKDFVKNLDKEPISYRDKFEFLLAFLDGYVTSTETTSKILKVPLIIDEVPTIDNLLVMMKTHLETLENLGIDLRSKDAEKRLLQNWKSYTNIAYLDEYKKKLAELYNLLEKNRLLFMEVFEDIVKYFILVEEGKKPAIELEITTEPKNFTTIKKIEKFKNDLEKFGYYGAYTEKGKLYKLEYKIKEEEMDEEEENDEWVNYTMIVSKNKELAEIIAKAIPQYYHPLIRGIGFGYPEEETLKIMKKGTLETGAEETDPKGLKRVKEIISMMKKEGTLEDKLEPY